MLMPACLRILSQQNCADIPTMRVWDDNADIALAHVFVLFAAEGTFKTQPTQFADEFPSRHGHEPSSCLPHLPSPSEP